MSPGVGSNEAHKAAGSVPSSAAEPPAVLGGPVWPTWAGRAVDVTLLVGVVLLVILAWLGVTGAGRRTAAVLTLTVAPGWGTLRALGAPAGALTAVAAFALSTSLTMLTGLLLVTRLGWSWRGGLITIEALSVVGLVGGIRQWRRR